MAENDEVNSDPYHTVPKSSTVEEFTHHRRFPNYILAKKLRKRKNTRVILTRREYLRVKKEKNMRAAAILTIVIVLNWKHQNNSNVLIEKGLVIDVK